MCRHWLHFLYIVSLCVRACVCQTSVLILSLLEDGAKGWIADFLFYWLACCGWLVDEMETELVMWPTFFSSIPFSFEESLQHQKLWNKTGGYSSSTYCKECLLAVTVCLAFALLNYWSSLTFYVWVRNLRKSGWSFTFFQVFSFEVGVWHHKQHK